MLQPLIDVMIPFLPGWLELPASYVGLLKSAFHKYIRRVPKSGGGYRYFYHVGHGGGIANADHFVPGASFRFDGGHYHIKSEEGGKLTIEHDETKDRKTVSKAELQSMLTSHHEPAIKAHREKVAGMLAEAKANKASPKQIAKLEARAKAAGVAPQGEPLTPSQHTKRHADMVSKHMSEARRLEVESRAAKESFFLDSGSTGPGPLASQSLAHSNAAKAHAQAGSMYGSPSFSSDERMASGAAHVGDKAWTASKQLGMEHDESFGGGITDAHRSLAKRKGVELTPILESGSVLVGGNTFAMKDRIKSAGGRWDNDSKAWSVPVANLTAALK